MSVLAHGPATLYMYQNRGGCTYWRVFVPAQALVAAGYPVRSVPVTVDHAFDIAIQCRAVVLVRLAWAADRYLEAITWVRRLQARGVRVLYETDDDIFSEAWFRQGALMEPEKSHAQLEQDRQQRIRALRLCDGAIVTTPRLATLTRCYTEAPVVVVPNAIDWAWWRAVCRQGQRPPGEVLIGWAGGKRDDGDLAPMATAWGRIAARYPTTRFIIVGHQPDVLYAAVPPERLYLTPWQDVALYPTAYRGWDIGCAPLADVPFNYYKSAIKAYEYAAAGAAVVYSPPVYGRELRPDLDGLPATTADEWEAALAQLLDAPHQRRLMAARWARRVRARYSLTANLWRWPAAWASIVAARPQTVAG